jgi:hypothetical protein
LKLNIKIGLFAIMGRLQLPLLLLYRMDSELRTTMDVGSIKYQKAVYVTPSIVYAGHPRYAKIEKLGDIYIQLAE